MVFCRYFSNKYGVALDAGMSKSFVHVDDIRSPFPTIYNYIQAYSNYQTPSLSGENKKNKDGDHLIVIAHQGTPNRAPENSLS